jgi:chromosome segregation ATPase
MCAEHESSTPLATRSVSMLNSSLFVTYFCKEDTERNLNEMHGFQEFYENEKKELNQEIDDLKKEKTELERKNQELNSIIDKRNQEIDDLKKEKTELEQKNQELNSIIDKLKEEKEFFREVPFD